MMARQYLYPADYKERVSWPVELRKTFVLNKTRKRAVESFNIELATEFPKHFINGRTTGQMLQSKYLN